MSRQIRLADDVATIVEARQATEGGSLSENANAMIRELDRLSNPPVVLAQTALIAPVDQAEALIAVFDAAIPVPSPESSAAHRVAAAHYEEALGRRRRPKSARAAVSLPVAPAVGRCPHPLLARRDGACGRCGATLGDARPEAAAGR